MERPARADRDTDRAERGRCFDTHVQVFPLDEHRGQGRYPTYTPNSNIYSTCIQNEIADQMNILPGKCFLNFSGYLVHSILPKVYTR